MRELEDPKIWNDPDRAQTLGRERATLEQMVTTLGDLAGHLADVRALLDLAGSEDDVELFNALTVDLDGIEAQVAALEMRRMFSGAMDEHHSFLDIQSGSGGTEAQDWAEMLLRMYLRWGERRHFGVEVMEVTAGDVAGIKGATVRFEGAYAYGWLRTETGIHRLVRKSPFDSGNRRHTSFASVFAYPEVDEDVDIEINTVDLKVDTYRSSGAGGQHVNKTESAIRITHVPSGIVVQCQSERSQHKNRSKAMAQLKSKLYEQEMRKQQAEKQAVEDSKSDIGWGHQIRSYVLDQSRIKDLRTQLERGDPDKVLDGDLDGFMEASLKLGV